VVVHFYNPSTQDRGRKKESSRPVWASYIMKSYVRKRQTNTEKDLQYKKESDRVREPGPAQLAAS
jgi:hypothetical protein